MYSIFAELVTALAGAAFLGGILWLAAAKLTAEPVPAEAIIVTITAAIVGIVAGTSAADLRAAHRRERR